MLKILALLFVLLLFTGCNKENDTKENTNTNNTTIEDDTTTPTFPNVAGKYAITTNTISYTCTNGEQSTVPGFAQNSYVYQVDNEITIHSGKTKAEDDEAAIGLVVVDSTRMKGLVEKDSTFLTKNIMTVIFDQFGNAVNNYTLDGTFTSNSISGDYTYISSLQDYGITCTYTATFSGSKINSDNVAPLY